MNKCYICGEEGQEQKEICVDVDMDHDGDVWYQHPLYSKEWLCAGHLEAYDNNELYQYNEDGEER